MISALLVDLFCECRSCFVVCCFGFEKFQYTNVTRLVYFHKLVSPFTRLVRDWWCVLVVVWGVCLLSFSIVSDLSF